MTVGTLTAFDHAASDGGLGGRFLNVPRERLAEAGREVIRLRDDEIFEVVPSL